jgi:hypothetical protein
MNRAARRRAQSSERREILSVTLPGGEVVNGRPDDVARRLQAHLEATEPETAKRIAILAAADAWSSKQQMKAAAKERRSPPDPVVMPPGRVSLERLMSAPLVKESRT